MEPVFPFSLDLGEAQHAGLTQTLQQQLRAAIVDGRLVAGAQLPATRSVAAALGIARNTVVTVYDRLIAEGYVLARRNATPVVAATATASRQRRAATAVARSDGAWPNPIWRELKGDTGAQLALPARSFRLGIPEHQHFPHALWRRLSASVLREWSRRTFDYPPAEGICELREAIAGHVAFARAVACTPDRIVVTTGAQQAFDLLARLLVTPGRTAVAVEEPGYPPQRWAMQAAGAWLRPVPVDEEGLCVDRLPEDVRLVCVTPSHQSPTGVTMSLRRRRALLAWANDRGGAIIEDDYDGEFRYGDRPLDALQTLDRDGAVFYVGTFSKSLFPALRKGYIVAPQWALEPLQSLKRSVDSHCDAPAQALLARFIRDGHLARHVRRMQAVYAGRRQALVSGLAGCLAPWLQIIPSEAGLHLAARIREPHEAEHVIQLARRHLPGSQSTAAYAHAVLDRPALAIGFGVIDSEQIDPALQQLRQALEALSAGRGDAKS
jgi:GntR family transcriptional regulator / MocR family aminotransferase